MEMAAQKSSSDRFRSATDFPKTIASLNPTEAEQIYVEMRECLIFTNRSRSQLIRRNEEHKQTVLALKSDLMRLQAAINQLNQEKQQLAQSQQAVIAELNRELQVMTNRMNQLSQAFSDVEDVNNAMGVMAIPGRFSRFWQALKALILWWREEYGDDLPENSGALPGSAPNTPAEEDRRNNPQMYTDPASIQRSERDW
jgi:TolA-binding protein